MNSMWVIMAVYGVYIGLTEGVEKAFITDLAGKENRATLIGLHATLVGIALLPASLIAGVLWNTFGPAAPFYFGSIMGLLSCILFVFLL
jgi:MFS family permease